MVCSGLNGVLDLETVMVETGDVQCTETLNVRHFDHYRAALPIWVLLIPS